MNLEELEFSISQYLDGTLPPLERAALEGRLANDPQAQEILAEQRKLNELLATVEPLPAVNWEKLSRRISRSVDQAEAPAVSRYRIGGGRIAIGITAAACLLIAATVTMVLLRPGSTYQTNTQATGVQGFASVAVLTTEQPQGTPITQIRIGPAPRLASGAVWRHSDVVVSRPAQVFIAKGRINSQDTASLPF
ncbi:MAG: hypothetical protein IT447_14360 [Phycisphaerales bacterium]|jgi:hypothetical protein|nr:hypothetical protein [Phycisphaerales bacterium]